MTIIVGPTLPEPYYSDVEGIWDDVAEAFGENGILNPYPHFTLYHLADADVDAVERRVEEAVRDHDPVEVRTDGLGVFPGHHVYAPVTNSLALDALHRDVADAVDDLGTAPTPYYDPGNWFPHVALALGFDRERVPEVVSFLLDYDLDREFAVDTIAVTRPPREGEEHELVTTIDL